MLGLNIMEMGDRTPVCRSHLGRGSTNGDFTKCSGENIPRSAANNQDKIYGNRIGHDPKAFKKFDQRGAKRPPTLLEILKLFDGPSLNTKNYPEFYFHKDEAGAYTRQIRSELREGVDNLFSAFIFFYQMETGEILCPNGVNGLVSPTLEWLAARTGMSLIRIKRICRFLENRGFIIFEEQKSCDSSGKYKSKPARKFLTLKFFMTLGQKYWHKIKLLKEWAFKKRRPVINILKLANEMIKDSITPIIKKPKYESENSSNSVRKEKSLYEQAEYLYEKDPSIPKEEYFRRLKYNTT
jgi:hypothetical protein